jgi:hypothetical protein
MAKTIKGIVLRGYITRFDRRTEWEEELSPVPAGAQLCDGDAVQYYVQRPDGKFREIYDLVAPDGVQVYELAENAGYARVFE